MVLPVHCSVESISGSGCVGHRAQGIGAALTTHTNTKSKQLLFVVAASGALASAPGARYHSRSGAIALDKQQPLE